MTSAHDFLNKGGAKRFPKTIAWGDRPVGSSVGGIILEDPIVVEQTDMETKQTRYFQPNENGEREPMMQMMVVIQSDEANPATEDDGKRTLAIRGGFKYESSKKALVEELQRNGLEIPRIGDYVKLTRIENRKGQGFASRTHQFACDYVKVEDFTDELKTLATMQEVAEVTAAEPVKRGRPAKKAAPATSAWEE